MYWASVPVADGFGSLLADRIDGFYQAAETSGHIDLLRRAYNMYHGLDPVGRTHAASRSALGGDAGELIQLQINDFRNLCTHILNMITQSRPAWDPRATNTDSDSLRECQFASNLLDFYMRQHQLENRLKDAQEYQGYQGEGWVRVVWDATAGKPYAMAEDGSGPVNEGDVDCLALGALDVVRDYHRELGDHDWYAVRVPHNKWDLIAKFPEYASEIGAASHEMPDQKRHLQMQSPRFTNQQGDPDLVYVYEFYHSRTPAMLEGRVAWFVSSDAILLDGPLPYEEPPVYWTASSKFRGTPWGYTHMWDVMGLQTAFNSLMSTVQTNYEAHGVQHIVSSDNAELNINDVMRGLAWWKIPPGAEPPRGINLTAMPPGIDGIAQMYRGIMESISGVNSVVRGDPQANLKSGSALALVQAQAVQFVNGSAQSYTMLLEKVGTGLLRIFKRYANTERIAYVAGKTQRYAVRKWSSADLTNVDNVVVDSGNPIGNTLSGKLELANNFTDRGWIQNPVQYYQVLQTGKLEQWYEADVSTALMIKAENEKLMDGPPLIPGPPDPITGMPTIEVQGVTVLYGDHPVSHIKEHLALLDNPEVRGDPVKVAAITAHVDNHLRVWVTTSPVILQLLGYPMPPAGPGVPLPEQPVQMPPQPPPQASGGNPMAPTEPEQPNLPNMPVNPATGERAPSVPGATVQ